MGQILRKSCFIRILIVPWALFTSGAGTTLKLGGGGQTSTGVQGNPYPKLKTPRIWHTIFWELDARTNTKIYGARVGRVLLYVCVKCGHAFALRRLDGRPKAKSTGHALNARMLGTPLGRRSQACKLGASCYHCSPDSRALLLTRARPGVWATFARPGGGADDRPLENSKSKRDSDKR